MSILAIIPARGGSKGVPRKNIREVHGLPLIEYTIRQALKSSHIQHLAVSTDDQEIAKISKDAGAQVPFLRPDELAGDTVSDLPVLKHALNWYLENVDSHIEFVLLLRPTTPLKTKEDMEFVIQKWRETQSPSIRTVSQVPGKYHPYWTFQLKNGQAQSSVPGLDLKKFFQRQLLPATYFVNGLVDGYCAKSLLSGRVGHFSDGFEAVVTPIERCLDIDTEADLLQFEQILDVTRGP